MASNFRALLQYLPSNPLRRSSPCVAGGGSAYIT